MSFALTLVADVVEAEAGATTPVGLTVVNRGEAIDRYEVVVEGIDGEWTRLPVPSFTVEPGESRSEKFLLVPPRLPESVAGAYPFVVGVRSLESGEAREAQGLLKLRAYHHVTMEIAPKKGVVSPTTKRNDFRLTVVNLGNSEQTLQLTAQDPDDRCAFEFENDQIVLGPGQQRDVEMVADPKQTPLFSSGRLIGFSVFARSLNERSVAATAQAQLEQRSLLSPATIAFLILLVALVGGWYAMRPQPTTLQLAVNPGRATRGETVQVAFVARNADRVRIDMDGTSVYDGPPTTEARPVVLAGTGRAIFHAEALRDGKVEATQDRPVEVLEPVVAALPKIVSLKADPERVKLNTQFLIRWKVTNATRVALSPASGGDLTPELESVAIVPTTTGEQTYTLFAYNADGKYVSRKVTVNVYQESEARILAFDANPPKAREEDGGRVTLSWNVTGAAQVQLKIGTGPLQTVEPSNAAYETTVGAKTTFTLVATDAAGIATRRKVTVDYEKKEIVIDPPPTTGGDPNFPDQVPPLTTGGGTPR